MNKRKKRIILILILVLFSFVQRSIPAKNNFYSISYFFHDTIIIIVEPSRSFRYESMNKKGKEREEGKENSKYISCLVRGLYETPFQRKNMVLDQEIVPNSTLHYE